MSASGHDVVAVGLAGARSEAPSWRVVSVPEARRRFPRISTALRGACARLGTRAAIAAYWSATQHRSLYRAVEGDFDLVVANDWRALPIAARVAKRSGASVHYDSHEYAIEERADDRAWRMLIRPLVQRIENAYIGHVQGVSTVGEEIAEALREHYDLVEKPVVVRNVPAYEPMRLKRVGDPITYLFHGGFAPDRGLEELLKSVPMWNEGRHLVVRGMGSPAYTASLQGLVEKLGVTDRVRFERPVPMLDLIQFANKADVGMFTPLGVSSQSRFALPNKLFEYIMAGLAICISDLPEMGRIVREFRVGVLIERTTPEAIADAVNGLGPAEILGYKERSLKAAKILSWEQEQGRLLDAIGRSLRTPEHR